MNPDVAALSLVQLTKRFGADPVVCDLSFEVGQGEVYGLLGPNGAGKTTTLRMVAGLLRPDAGRVLVLGDDVSAQPERARRLTGFQTAATGLYARLTARETLEYFGRLSSVAEPMIESRITWLAEKLDLGHLLDRRCESLSTGEKQRVSLARAVVHDPPILVFDEPTSGLDVLASRFFRELVLAEKARGKAVLFSTHYMTEAELLCDRIGFCHQGRLLTHGRPQDLRQAHHAQSLEEVFLQLVTPS